MITRLPRLAYGRRSTLAATTALVLAASGAGAQGLPDAPVVLADGRVVLGLEASATFSPSHDDGYFNHTDYDLDSLRLLRVNLTAAYQAIEGVAVLAELRSDNTDGVRASALYVRLRPMARYPVDVQIGRIPPVFGAFPRRGYGSDSPLIGYPLAYQYLTSIRADALPATADDLLRMRGRGWLVSYPIGSASPDHGLPLVSALRWDTGVQVRATIGRVEAGAALTLGSLSNPLVGDDNSGKQISGRVSWRPVAGLIVGVSGAHGAYIASDALADVASGPSDGSPAQRALGVDMEFGRDRWLLRGEAILSSWRLPAASDPRLADPVRALGWYVESRYRVAPAVYLAGRVDGLRFSRLQTTTGSAVTWDAPVTRVEVGGGYYLRRNVIAKVVYQHNHRDSSYRRTTRLSAAQLVFWF